MAKVALVTGSSSGFGLLTAVGAARRGWVVYAGVRDPTRVDGLRAAAEGLPVHIVPLDVTRADQRREAVARVLDEQGHVDALVNNAGVALGGFLETVEEDELRAVLETNLVAPWALTREVLPSMRARREGRIVMVGSMSGRVGLPGVGAYAASKFGLEGLSESWRHELALFGIPLLLVEPAQFRTDIFGRNRAIARRAQDPDSPWLPWARHLDGVVRAMVERTAGDPQEVADLIVRLLEARRPGFRHPVGPNVWIRLALASLAPFWLTERVMARFLTLPDRPAD